MTRLSANEAAAGLHKRQKSILGFALPTTTVRRRLAFAETIVLAAVMSTRHQACHALQL